MGGRHLTLTVMDISIFGSPAGAIARIHPEQAASADTVVMVMARDGLETAAMWSAVIVGVFFLLLVPVLLVLFFQLRKINRTVRKLGEQGLQRADPLLDRGKSIADNVEFVTLAVRTDVQRMNASVKALTERLHQASDHMEERIEEFNALMEVVQSEAEDLFLGTAATVRGVQAGARRLGEAEGRRGSRPGGPVTPDEEEELRHVPTGRGEGEKAEVYLSRPDTGAGAPAPPSAEGGE